MFQELMPLLAQRTLLLMVSRVGADEIRISVIPQRAKSADPDQNDAIFTPLSISGTPRELDEALPGQLVEFVGTHLGLSSTLKSAKEQMDAAAKAAREMARKAAPQFQRFIAFPANFCGRQCSKRKNGNQNRE